MDGQSVKRARKPVFKVTKEMYGDLVDKLEEFQSKISFLNKELFELKSTKSKKQGITVDEYFNGSGYKTFDTGAIHAVQESQKDVDKRNNEISQRNELTTKAI